MKFIKYLLIFILLFFVLQANIFAYPSNILIYPEKLISSEVKFLYNYLFDNKIEYSLSIINKNNDQRSKFIGTALSSFFDIYFIDKKIILNNKEKDQILSFIFDKLAIYFQKQRSINNQFAIDLNFWDKIKKDNFVLFYKTDKDKSKNENDDSKSALIYFEISYDYDFKNSKINIICKKEYIFNREVYTASFVLDYKYLSFYNDFANLFINKIMSFLLNQRFHKIEIELNNSAFVQVDGKVIGYFENQNYPATFEIILEEGEHEIFVFEDGYDSFIDKIDLKEDKKIYVDLKKLNLHCLLTIKTFPAGARIKIGNKLVGNSPIKIELPSGNHVAVISQEGYESKEVLISINDNEFEKEIYIYLMPVNTTSFYIDYSNKILDKVYSNFWYGCYGLAFSIAGTILYNYFLQFSNSAFYSFQYLGIYGSLSIITAGLITFAIFEFFSLTELWKYYQFIKYYTL